MTQISADSPFMLLGLDGWREHWAKEAYILRESRVATDAARDRPLRRHRLGGALPGRGRTPAATRAGPSSS